MKQQFPKQLPVIHLQYSPILTSNASNTAAVPLRDGISRSGTLETWKSRFSDGLIN
jgi:hypothetical protein